MIYLDGVSVEYQKGDVGIQDISLSINRGEFVSLVGQSGAGKTTIIKVLLGERKPTEGGVFFDSVDITKIPSRKLNQYRRNIGVVFQEFRLLPDKTVYENVAFAMEAAGKSDEQIEKDVPYVLKLVGLDEKMDRFPRHLSGGQRQRVAIARAIVNQPDLIIADEPTGNLDPINADEIIEIFKKINKMGTTVILTTHNKAIVDRLEGRVITMDRGRIVRDTTKGGFVL